ncbi:hypothetical protein M409DRAFT_49772 [Zasmidium cellare ATCC 36951]|uniref:SnoaL-like domain-containing protein n=1 Tax=Zasmidium cellare ATCC 36951 TaxID=1080233 RepID=A0A6A6D1T2_ZASCE|nr:uncharacterized protein M409DRAFT_49772 [Zasmidium cellare ATCC 36951]KAF2173311.1 hypothetical protein M409DRAFT_49772 [Zasmidium cellare ATCC 36951]
MKSFTATAALIIGLLSSGTCAKSDWEAIHDTINRYSIFIDTKDFASLDRVFSSDAYANYGGAWADLYGIDAIIEVCKESVAGHTSQHLGSVMGIDIHENENEGSGQQGLTWPYNALQWILKQHIPADVPINSTANSTTYDQSTLFADPYYNGSVIYYFGYYLDELQKLEEGWRITNRTWAKAGPGYSGNYSVATA